MSDMKDLVEYIARCLVEKPDEIHVHEAVGVMTSIYEIRAAEGETGRIVGKHGDTIRAIRTIVNAIATKQNKRVVIELSD
jgi:hypothetical protein